MTAKKHEDACVCADALAQVVDTFRAVVKGEPFLPAVVREGRQRCDDNPYRPPCSPLHMVWAGVLQEEEALTAVLAEWISLAKIYSRLLAELEPDWIAARVEAHLGEYVFAARRYSSAHGALGEIAEGLLENLRHGPPDMEAMAECFDGFLGDADFSQLLAGLEQERAALERRQESPKGTLGVDPKSGDETDTTIWYRGSKCYARAGMTPISVSRTMDLLLLAFLDAPIALTTKQLEELVENPTKTIKVIESKFGKDAVARPKAKGDGYFISVKTPDAAR